MTGALSLSITLVYRIAHRSNGSLIYAAVPLFPSPYPRSYTVYPFERAVERRLICKPTLHGNLGNG
jgi:hypothetical protein